MYIKMLNNHSAELVATGNDLQRKIYGLQAQVTKLQREKTNMIEEIQRSQAELRDKEQNVDRLRIQVHNALTEVEQMRQRGKWVGTVR